MEEIEKRKNSPEKAESIKEADGRANFATASTVSREVGEGREREKQLGQKWPKQIYLVRRSF